MSGPARYDVVIPTSGRPSLDVLLAALGAADGPLPERVLLVDDRADAAEPPAPRVPGALQGRTFLVRGGGRGPAAARNLGWRAGTAPWVAFLDDDVIPPPGWRAELASDLTGLAPTVAASQGRVRVPMARGVRPTDWQRNVSRLEHGRWATADLAFRRAALEAVGGFDERVPRADRENAELGLRLAARGLAIVAGRRRVLHPVTPADRWVSVRKQARNADDALTRALHGRAWRAVVRAPPGRPRPHAATTAAGAIGAAAALSGHPRTAVLAGAAWLAGTAAIRARRPPDAAGAPLPAPPLAVLLDRDGTLIHDVPYNADPGLVLPMPGVRRALDRLRARGIKVAIVSNQSGIGRGLLTSDQVAAVTRRVVELLGPFDDVRWCPHVAADGCDCRKPAPGLLLAAAAAVGVDPLRCAVVGDIGADVDAARAAGMRGILVPTIETRPEEIAAAAEQAASFAEAVDRLLRDPSLEPAPVVSAAGRARSTPSRLEAA